MKEKIEIALNTPWKLFYEIGMYIVTPFVYFYLKVICGVKIGKGAKFYGFPIIYKHRGSKIIIGDNFECRSWKYSNPLGLNHRTIICTWEKGSKITVGNDVGISGATIISAKEIIFGDRVLVGANSTIIDTDFHPTKGIKRYSKKNINSESVKIGDDAFIGMNVIILKGAKIEKNLAVPAGGVVR